MADPSQENPNFNAKIDALRELPLTENDPRLDVRDLIACPSCSRTNPRNRTGLYCGKPLGTDSISTDLARVNYQRPEAWEDGFSLVYAGKRQLTDELIAAAAQLLQINADLLKEILNIDVPVPLVYLRSLPDAGLLASRLSDINFDCAVVGDDLLQAKTPPTRVRSVRFEADAALLEDFNTSRITQIRFDEKVLFVAGSLVKTSTALAGKVSKGVLKATEETHGFLDESVIDIYPKSDVYGYRIRSAGFDFSCLGEKMQRFTGVNVAQLTVEFRSRYTSAILVDSYKVAGPLLSLSWPVEEIKQASNVTRGPLGGVHKETLMVLDNTVQFTKFARLQRHFI